MDADKRGADALHLANYSSSNERSFAPMVKNKDVIQEDRAGLAGVREADEYLEVSPSKAGRAGGDGGQPRTLSADALRRNFDESDDEDSGSLGFSFDPYAANRGTGRYREKMEARQQLSGCVFGILGLVVLGLSAWLLHRGTASHRQEEITTYLEDVRVSKVHFFNSKKFLLKICRL